MPAAQQFADHILLARDQEEFVNALERAVAAGGDAAGAARRQAAVAGHSWAARFEAVERILAGRLAQGTP
jgi:hypothetical protein